MGGDSLTPAVSANLQLLYPNRVAFNGDVARQTTTEIATRMLADTQAHNTWINVFWYGQSNVKHPLVNPLRRSRARATPHHFGCKRSPGRMS